jgi:hypothetical protein
MEAIPKRRCIACVSGQRLQGDREREREREREAVFGHDFGRFRITEQE